MAFLLSNIQTLLHNEELHGLCSSPNIIPVIKSRRMSWARHVACVGRREMHTRFWPGSLREIPLGRRRRRWEDNIKMNF
jgi:hypothetical protein